MVMKPIRHTTLTSVDALEALVLIKDVCLIGTSVTMTSPGMDEHRSVAPDYLMAAG